MDTLENNISINSDELAASVQSMVRGTDNKGNYVFESYSPKSPVTCSVGYRVATVLYKTNNKTGKIAGENSCLIVSALTDQEITAQADKLLKHVRRMLELEQNKMIKEAHLKKVTFISPLDLSLDKIIEAMEAESVSGRIN